MIVATGLNGEIGQNNKLMWKQKADMDLFKALTTGGTVVMGRNTWESIPEKFRPLPNRTNIVISKTLDAVPDVIVVDSILGAIRMTQSLAGDKLWFIGGQRIYKEALPYCDMLVITRIQKEFPEADAHFKESLDLKNHGFKMRTLSTSGTNYNSLERINEMQPADDKNQYDYIFETWDKI